MIALAGCGRIGFEPRLGVADGSTDDAAPCAGPFGSPRPVTEVNSSDTDWGAYMTDGGELYFSSDRPGGPGSLDLYVARRPSPSEPFGPPVMIAELSTASFEDNPWLEPDGLRMWFDRGSDVHTATRATMSSPWVDQGPVAAFSGPDFEDALELSPDLLTAYFGSDRPGGAGDVDLWYATRASASVPFGTASPLSINTAAYDCCPHVLPGGREVLFGHKTPSAQQLVAARAPDGTLGTPTIYPPLAGVPGDVIDTWTTSDGVYLGFSGDRGTGYDLYLMERSCP